MNKIKSWLEKFRKWFKWLARSILLSLISAWAWACRLFVFSKEKRRYWKERIKNARNVKTRANVTHIPMQFKKQFIETEK